MKCSKCNKDANNIRRGMCMSCYRKETGLSTNGKSSSQSLEKLADNIIKFRYEIKKIESQINKLPKLRKELGNMLKKFESRLGVVD